MMLKVGLNPYGLTYTLGLQGAGTPRQNPHGRGLEGFIELATGIGAETIELHLPWLEEMSDAELSALRRRLDGLGLAPVIGSGLPNAPVGTALRPATALGARTVRLALTKVLCGERAALGEGWPALVDEVRRKIGEYAALAREAGVTLAIENHQDFGSRELVAFCEEAGDNVGICYDLGNSFPVAEAPIDFTRRVAAKVRHVHLKDYVVQFTDEGFRLVRCPVGDGAVPIREIVDILSEHHDTLTASIELAALEARHVRLLRPAWWEHYPPVGAPELAACLAAARKGLLPEEADHRTPWEREDDGALAAWEVDQLHRSARNLTALGLMKGMRH
jgi:sugar phosphate isomerase/epimerase